MSDEREKWLAKGAALMLAPTNAPIVQAYAEGAMAALAARPGLAEWQFDMEKAPRDRHILGWVPSDERKPVQELWWASDYEGGPGYWSTPVGRASRGWTVLPEGVKAWMELPTPPANLEQ